MTFSRRHFLHLPLAAVLVPVAGRALAQSGPRALTLRAASGAPLELPGNRHIIPLIYDAPTVPQVLRARRGETLELQFVNDLDQSTSLIMQGHHQPLPENFAYLAPKSQTAALFTLKESGTLWLHPQEADQIRQGLGTLLVVEDDQPPPVDLDLPLLIQDWSSDDEKPVLTVNGRLPGEQTVLAPGARVRLRLVNASIGRGFMLRFSGAAPSVIAIDSVPSEKFRPVNDTLPFIPGARFEIMFDLGTTKAEIHLHNGTSELLVHQFVPDGAPASPRPAIAPLPTSPFLPQNIRLEDALRSTIAFGSGADHSALHLERGRPTTLALVNNKSAPLSLMFMGLACRVLHALDDGWEPYWRDSLLLAPGQTLHVALQPDEAGAYGLTARSLDHDAASERILLLVGEPAGK